MPESRPEVLHERRRRNPAAVDELDVASFLFVLEQAEEHLGIRARRLGELGERAAGLHAAGLRGSSRRTSTGFHAFRPLVGDRVRSTTTTCAGRKTRVRSPTATVPRWM